MAEALSPAHSSLNEYIARGEDLMRRCVERPDIHGTAKLGRKLQAEVKFLKKLHKKDKRALEMHLKSTNLTHLEAIVKRMETLPGVTHVLKRFQPMAGEPIVVDVICNQGYTWVKVIARKAEALHRIWAGGGQFGDKNLVEQASVYADCTKLYMRNFTPPQLLFIFCQGVSSAMKAALENNNIIVDGQVHDLDIDPYASEAANTAQGSHVAALTDDKQTKGVEQSGQSFWSCEADVEESGDSDSSEELLTASELLQRQKGHHDLLGYIAERELKQCKTERQRSGPHDATSQESVGQAMKCSDTQPSEPCEALTTQPKRFIDVRESGRPDTVHSHGEYDVMKKRDEGDVSPKDGGTDSPSTGCQKCDSAQRHPVILRPAGTVCAHSDYDRPNPASVQSLKNSGANVKNNTAVPTTVQNQRNHARSTNNHDSELVPAENNESNSEISGGFDLFCDKTIASAVLPTHLISQPQIKKLNLDITTLISYISNLCHGHCRYKFREPILTEQASQERRRPLLPILDKCFHGKDLFICETALSDFRNILTTVGGPSECQRAEELLARVTVIPDNMSPRIAALPTSAKIKSRAKVIFGTAESFQAITVTANSGFVRAAEHKGICIPVILHESRALTEKKQACALPI